jgi:hypothetical protein
MSSKESLPAQVDDAVMRRYRGGRTRSFAGVRKSTSCERLWNTRVGLRLGPAPIRVQRRHIEHDLLVIRRVLPDWDHVTLV